MLSSNYRKGGFSVDKFRKWQSWLLIGWAYSLFALIGLMSLLPVETALVCLALWGLVMLAVCGLNIRVACRAGENAAMRGMVMKLVLIPFYAGVFVLGIITFAAPPVFIGLFLMDGLLLLTTSAYGLAAVFGALREKRLPLLPGMLLGGGHLLFAADVVCSVVLWVWLRRMHQ